MAPSTFSRSTVRGSAKDLASTPGETPPSLSASPKRGYSPVFKNVDKRWGVPPVVFTLQCDHKWERWGLRERTPARATCRAEESSLGGSRLLTLRRPPRSDFADPGPSRVAWSSADTVLMRYARPGSVTLGAGDDPHGLPVLPRRSQAP